MIQLTKDIIAVEVPSDAFGILLIHGNTRLAYFHPNYKRIDYFHPNYKRIDLDCRAESLIGVTPLSEGQWKEVMDSKQIGDMTEPRWRNHQYGEFILYGLKSATESGLSLLESKGLDVNKKYAIIKIEK